MAKKRTKKSARASSSKSRVIRSNRTLVGARRKYNIPSGIKIIAVIFYVVAVLHIIASIFMFIGGIAGQKIIASFGVDKLLKMFPNSTPEDIQNAVSMSPYLIAAAALLLGLAVLEFYVGKGLFNAKNWARYTALVFVTLGLINSLTALKLGYVAGSLIMFLAYAVVGWYLWLDIDVQRTFGEY
jgi:hypothetical protein